MDKMLKTINCGKCERQIPMAKSRVKSASSLPKALRCIAEFVAIFLNYLNFKLNQLQHILY